MLTATATAEFVGGKYLLVKMAVQPDTPHEHDLLVKIAEKHKLKMHHGRLTLGNFLSVPENDLLADLEQTSSSVPSDATSVSDKDFNVVDIPNHID